MKLGAQGLELLKHFEGCQLKAYLCPAGIPTIGYGHTRRVKLGDVWTQEQADAYLQGDAMDAVIYIPKQLTYRLKQSEFDALICFIFNVGAGAFLKSTMYAKLMAGDWPGVPEEFDRWVKAGGHTLPGLVRRRAAERRLFETGTWQ